MECSQQRKIASGRRNRAEGVSLQALAEVALAYEELSEEQPALQTPVAPGIAQPQGSARMGKAARSGHAKRLEPESPRLVEANSQVCRRFAEAGWLKCLKKFQGHDLEVTYHFILSLSGNTMTVKGIKF